ncbi:MAG TPA: hypothetical protein VK746_07875, partial [Candidatus Eisenbacteria bacterium]|nr:hypothetical protein [Candidatus Eisenbacteria bacterium]
HWTTHRNRSGQAPACLFHLNDEPALRALGLFHEEGRGAAEGEPSEYTKEKYRTKYTRGNASA